MKNPPAATAAVAAHEPVRTAAPAQAMVVVTRWPPGLMSSPNATRVPPLDHPFGGGCAPAAAQRRARNGASASGPTTPAIYSPFGAIFPRRRWVSGYVPVAIFGVLIIAFGVVSLAIAWLLRPSRPDIVKLMNYECGAEPIGPAWVRFPVGFYLVALVFIVFDALAVFLFPWALILKAAGLGAFWAMAMFIAI